ncbi:MAG TPA: hypothetical protein VD905_18220, partial [Flavobacteriales bacterium]|nr:hypothetical protein [Flavobacteriales bacterium]
QSIWQIPNEPDQFDTIPIVTKVENNILPIQPQKRPRFFISTLTAMTTDVAVMPKHELRKCLTNLKTVPKNEKNCFPFET